jgi:hypothetical protein
VTLPAEISVSFDFSSGATFGYPFTIGDAKYGVLGTGTLGSSTVPVPIVDLTSQVRNITINRGRDIQADQYIAGTAVVRIIDPDSAWNPQNVNSPFYPYLVPLRKVRISATTATTQEFLFSGYTTEYRYTYDQAEQMGYVDIYIADAFRLFNLAQVTTVADSGAGQINRHTHRQDIRSGGIPCQYANNRYWSILLHCRPRNATHKPCSS